MNNELTHRIIGCAIEVHKHLGPGLLESTYKECFWYEMVRNDLYVAREVPCPVIYKDVKLEHGYRIDLLVEDKVIIEVKTVDTFNDVHSAQLLTYMKLSGYSLGLLINFNVLKLTSGIKRLIL